MTATFNCAHGNRGYGHPGYSLLAGLARPPTDGGASAADLRARGRGGRLRPAVLGQATGRETTLGVDHTRPGGAFGAKPPYVKPTTKGRAKPEGAKPGYPGHRR